jgi:tRNA pseudouridine38-40 synthase
MLAPYVWACRFPLELALLQQAAAHILGTHDFTSFAAVDPDLTSRRNTHSQSIATVAPLNSAVSSLPQLEFSPPNEFQPDKEIVISTEVAASRAAVASPSDSVSTPTETLTIPTNNTRTIFHSTWHRREDILIYRVTGSGFLHHMVRNLVGTFVETASNRFQPDAIPKILAARNRSAAGPTAPARGLFLVEVEY